MYEEETNTSKAGSAVLAKFVFVIGLLLVVGSGLMIVGGMAGQERSQASAAGEPAAASPGGGSETSILGQLTTLLSSAVEPPKPRWELDQIALPKTPEGWGVVVGVGGVQTHALAKEVYNAMHNPEGPLDAAALAAYGAAQGPNGLLSEALSGAQQSMQDVGVSEEAAAAQTAVNPLWVQLGDGIARKNDQYDQSRVYISGEDVVMVMVRRLPPSYRAKGSWLQITSPGVPVPVALGGHEFLESARTAQSDDIHALRLDITGDLFIEIGGRVDREVLESFAEAIDFAAL